MRFGLVNGSALLLVALTSCIKVEKAKTEGSAPKVIEPSFATDSVRHDSDDPAIWINRSNLAESLIIGTDKGGDTGDGALYVFDLNGREIKGKTIHDIKRPNNVDIAYGVTLSSGKADIAVLTERNTNSLRIFSLPDLKALDNGGLPVFEGDTARAPMGVALFTSGERTFAIVSRKTGPDGSYLWQYELVPSGEGLALKLVRKFGKYSGKHEIEAVAVDNELGYVYYSDEGAGVRKYYAHPDSSNTELAFFATTGFADNHEGISIYKTSPITGYLIVSDQQANRFHVFVREGSSTNPHNHPELGIFYPSTIESDGSEVTSVSLPGFEQGLFVAMSDDKTFHLYSWKDLAAQLRKDSVR